MKLNKNGWSLTVEVVYIIIFVLCLIIAIIGIIRMNLLMDREENKENEVKFDYTTLEEKLEEAAERYIDDKTEINSEEVVKSSTLISEGYITSLKDGDNTDCRGYVEVKINENSYNAFITCFDYTTKGYNYKKE